MTQLAVYTMILLKDDPVPWDSAEQLADGRWRLTRFDPRCGPIQGVIATSDLVTIRSTQQPQ